MNKFRSSTLWRVLSPIGRLVKKFIRKNQLLLDEFIKIFGPNHNLRVFNLDLHVGVIADLEAELNKQGVDLTRWSISGSNGLIRKFLTLPDPVAHINASTWRTKNNQIHQKKFKKRYSKFLSAFDGFVFTYSPTLATLVSQIDKPILIVAATRYETPFTNRPKEWGEFNIWLKNSSLSGQVILAANNRGDADYLEYYTGIKPAVVPSLCEKNGEKWRGGSGRRVVIGRVPELVNDIYNKTNGYFEPISSLGSPYSWHDLLGCEEVLVLPQNISTMTMFELATAGVPVCVPSKLWMKELRIEYPQLLEELSFAQLENVDIESDAEDGPNNWKSESFLDWWLDRADFYDKKLMPNVSTVNNMEDLSQQRVIADKFLYFEMIDSRNRRIESIRTKLITEFISSCKRTK